MSKERERREYIRETYSLTERGELWYALNKDAPDNGFASSSKQEVIRRARAHWGHFNYRDEAEEFDKIFPSSEVRKRGPRQLHEKEKALLRLTLNTVAVNLDKQVEMLVALAEIYPGLECREEFAPFDLEEAAERIRTLRDKYV